MDSYVFLQLPLDFEQIDEILEKNNSHSQTTHTLRQAMIRTKLLVKRYKKQRQSLTLETAPEVKLTGRQLIVQITEMHKLAGQATVVQDPDM